MNRLKIFGAAFFLIFAGMSPAVFSDPILNQGRMLDDRIMIFPDHVSPKVFYYVPVQLKLTQSYDKPEFFFYKYVYIKPDSSEETERMAGGVLAFSVEFSDETGKLKEIMGEEYVFKPVQVESLRCVLNLSVLEGEEAREEELARQEFPWTKKNFTLSLSRMTAPYLWEIFKEEKTLGLSLDCDFSYSGFELKEGKYEEAKRSDRLAFPVTVSMQEYPELFQVINLAEKGSFNYRRMEVICFDFANAVNQDLMRKTVEIEIETARGQRDFKRIDFTEESEVQQVLEFDIPEKKGGTYRYRIIQVFHDGRSQRSEWIQGDDYYLDVSEYEIIVKDKQ